MKPKQLYDLIINLSRDQKGKVSRFLESTKGSQNPHYLLLYKRLSELKNWDDDSENQIRGNELVDPTIFYQNKELLLEKIIWALSESSSEIPNINFIRVAVEYNAIDLARRTAKKILKTCQATEDYWGLLALLRLNQELIELYYLPIIENTSPELLKRAKIACDIDLELSDLYKKLKGFIHRDPSEWKFLGEGVFSRLGEIRAITKMQRFQSERLKSRALWFSGESLAAIRKHEKLINEFEGAGIPNGLWLQDLSLLIQLYGDSGQDEKAHHWTLKLGAVPIDSEQDRLLQKSLWIKNALLIADRFWRYELSEKALDILEENPEIFDKNYKAILQYTGALIAWGTDHWDHSLKILEKIRRIPKRDRPLITWQPYILKVIVNLTKGDDTNSSIRSAKRFLKKQELHYPWLILRISQEVHKNPRSITNLAIENWINEYNEIIAIPEEKTASYYFDFELWLKALQKSLNMAQMSRLEANSNIASSNSVAFL